MNKKIATLLITAAMLVSGVSAFAAATPAPTATAEASAAPTATATAEASAAPTATADAVASPEADAEDAEVIAPAIPAVNVYDATVVSTDDKTITVSIEETEYSFMYGENTAIYTVKGEKKAVADLKAETEVKVYSESELLTKDVKFADAVVIADAKDAASSVKVDYFFASEDFGEYIDFANTLALNIADETEIVDMEGKKVEKADIAGKKVMVFYSVATMSLPPQTNPEKIVVLPGEALTLPTATPEATATPAPTATPTPAPTVKPEDVKSVKAGNYTGAASYDAATKTYVLPVRAISEALGLTVGWDGDNCAVTVDNVSFKTGSKEVVGAVSYTMKKAADLRYDTTYVSSDFFTEALKLKVAVEDGVLVISK